MIKAALAAIVKPGNNWLICSKQSEFTLLLQSVKVRIKSSFYTDKEVKYSIGPNQILT